MKIIFHNLSKKAISTVKSDLNTVRKIFGGNVPDIKVKIVALACGNIPADMPAHGLKIPSTITPSSFRQYCNIEKDRQSFQILKSEKYLWVIGGDEVGACYGFDELMRTVTGVIWDGLNDEDINFGKAGEINEKPQRPVFAFRARYASASSPVELEKVLKWMRRNRWNLWVRSWAYFMTQNHNDRKKGLEIAEKNFLHITLTEHSMHYFLSGEIEKHPQWYGMRNGRHTEKECVEIPDCPHLNVSLPIQPCYSNNELIEFLSDRMADCISMFPTVKIWGVWPFDGVNNWCMCQKCTKKTPYEHMYNLAMRLLAKIPEGIFIELLSYSNLLNLPWHELPYSDRTITLLCTYLRQYKHRIFDRWNLPLVLGTKYPAPDRINPVDDREYGILFKRWLQVWEKCGSVPGIFEYGPQHYDETRRCDIARILYHPEPKIRYDEIKWYAENGVEVFYLCSIFSAWPDGFHQWALANNLWSPIKSTSYLEKYFYQAVAGEKGLSLRKLMKELHHKLLYDRQGIDEYLTGLQNVFQMIKNSNHVKRFSTWLEYVKMVYESRQAELKGDFKSGIKIEERIQKFCEENQSYLKNYVTIKNVLEVSKISEQRFEEWLEKRKSSVYTM